MTDAAAPLSDEELRDIRDTLTTYPEWELTHINSLRLLATIDHLKALRSPAVDTLNAESAACESAHGYPHVVHSQPCKFPACPLDCLGRAHRLSASCAIEAMDKPPTWQPITPPKDYNGWTCGRCGGPVAGRYSACDNCGLDPHAKDKTEPPTPPAVERDWPEDFHLENGNYTNRCALCGNFFQGYKRRVVCKACQEPTPQPRAQVIDKTEAWDMRERKPAVEPAPSECPQPDPLSVCPKCGLVTDEAPCPLHPTPSATDAARGFMCGHAVSSYKAQGGRWLGYATESLATLLTTRESAARKEEREPLLNALRLILPLAKGYVRDHRVGANQAYVDHAAAILATKDADK